MINRTARAIVSFGLSFGLLLSPVRLEAQRRSANLSEDSYRKARQVLEAGLRALGGLEAIAAIRNFTLVETGKRYDLNESPSAEPPLAVSNRVETTIFDFAGQRLFHEINHRWPHHVWHASTIINGTQGFALDLWSNEAEPLNSPSLTRYTELMRKLPHFFLREVLIERAASLRWLGETVERGRKQQVISFADLDGQQVALYFDAATHLLSKYETLYTDGCAGDARQESIFAAYRNVRGLPVPIGISVRLAGQMAWEMSYERVEINSELKSSLFELPEGIKKISRPETTRRPVPYAMSEIAKDVYLVERVGNYNNVLVVAFDDYALVVEAPESRVHAGASEQVIARIKETLPGKPIKYLVFTHHHLDHGCGVRAYISEGARIITTRGNARFVERLAAAPFTISPDAWRERPSAPSSKSLRIKNASSATAS